MEGGGSSTGKVEVGLIADHPQFVPTVADWWWQEWGDSYVVPYHPPIKILKK